MTTYHKQISSSCWALFTMIGGFLTSVFVLGVWMQIVQPLFAAQAAAVKGGAKVSIANFVFTPGEITIAPGETVTWANDDGAPHGLESGRRQRRGPLAAGIKLYSSFRSARHLRIPLLGASLYDGPCGRARPVIPVRSNRVLRWCSSDQASF